MQTTPKPVKWAAVLLLAQAALMLIGAGIVIAFTAQAIPAGNVPRGGLYSTGAVAGFAILTFMAYCMAPPLILLFGLVGVGLLRRWRWARTAAIIVSVLNALLTVPLGTVVGIAVIVLLNRPEAKAAFGAASPSALPTVS